ncbi:MAG: IspD/TarI family cytidylyltransferase [Rikenellaceae bacterium]
MRNIAVVLAGGSGLRAGFPLPKQFQKLSNKMVIEYSIEQFNRCALIDEIYIVVNKDYLSMMDSICKNNNWNKVSKVLCGGNERYDSTLAAINAYEGDECNIIFHDSVRPLVSERIITDVVKSLESHNAVNVAIPMVDTILRREGDYIAEIPNRANYLSSQTPQAFKLTLIKKAYELALNDPNFTTSDDCGVVKRYIPNEPIFLVEGDSKNLKLTYKEDILLLEQILNLGY